MRNLPNILSFGRLLATLPLIVLVLINVPAGFLGATGLFVAAGVTDTIDGRVARHYHLVTRLGVFLDLTADKVFVAAPLIALVQVGLVPAWIVIVIVTREFVVAGLRSLAAADGTVIAAGRFGKQKTFLTLISIGGILLARGLGGATAFPFGLASSPVDPSAPPDYLLAASDAVLLLATLWTVLSAVEYLREGWHVVVGPPASN